MDGFTSASVVEIAEAVRSGSSSAREQTERALAAIEAANETINAFVAVDPDRARAEADTVDARIAQGDDPGALAGVPIGVKDLENAIGYVTTMGSRLHENDPAATTDSVLVDRLRSAGAVVVGKTNTPEFGAIGDTYNDVFGITRNPHNPDRSAGGSSGGSGAALAAGMVPLATGSDGGGSIRIPSAINGLSGLKPSLGRIPLGGENPSTWLHFSTPGPMAKRIADVAYVLDAVVGPDPADRFSLPMPRAESWYDATQNAGLPHRVLWSPNMGFGVNDAETEAVVRSGVERLEGAGVEIIEVDVFESSPLLDWVGLAFVGLAAKMRPWIGTPQWELVGEPVRLAVEYAQDADRFTVYDSMVACHRVNRRFAELFAQAPLLLCPTMAGQTPIPTRQGTVNGAETVNWVEYTPVCNMTGQPAGTVNAGFTGDGMPVGLQVIGPQHADAAVLRAIAAFEEVLG